MRAEYEQLQMASFVAARASSGSRFGTSRSDQWPAPGEGGHGMDTAPRTPIKELAPHLPSTVR